MMMLQNPLFQEYNTALSQLLELHQQQHRFHQQQQQQQHHHHHHPRHNRGATAVSAAGAFQTYAITAARTASRDSAESDGLSSSSPRPCKPFTIDAILGLQAGQSASVATAAAAVAAAVPVDPSAVTALDFSTGSAAVHGKKHREGNYFAQFLRHKILFTQPRASLNHAYDHYNLIYYIYIY